MKFEWDPRKAKSSLKKHGVTSQEATTVFGDTFAVTFEDPDHSIIEYRFLTFGLSKTGKFLIVSHTMRSEYIRIISARSMSKQEKRIYEEG